MSQANPILEAPISWRLSPSFEGMSLLRDLQGNILKGHGRKHVCVLFLKFHDQQSARELVNAVHGHVTSALAQLEQAQTPESLARREDPYVGFVISKAGFDSLESPLPHFQDAFKVPMRARAELLGDDPEKNWEPAFKANQFDAALVIGAGQDAADRRAITAFELSYRSLLTGFADVVWTERGTVILDGGRSREPFGYADGFSQPLFLVEDIQALGLGKQGGEQWPQAFPLSNVLVKCPTGTDFGFGSFFIFRKLEQDVAKFRSRFPKPNDGAAVVGRMVDGTPLELSGGAFELKHPSNDFSFRTDPGGMRVGKNAHIRLANDREDRDAVFPRRGMPYRDPPDQPSAYDGMAKDGPQTQGLLFMAYNSNLEEQFEAMQKRLEEGDEVMKNFVTARGGEYFFAPSISGLRALADPA